MGNIKLKMMYLSILVGSAVATTGTQTNPLNLDLSHYKHGAIVRSDGLDYGKPCILPTSGDCGYHCPAINCRWSWPSNDFLKWVSTNAKCRCTSSDPNGTNWFMNDFKKLSGGSAKIEDKKKSVDDAWNGQMCDQFC